MLNYISRMARANARAILVTGYLIIAASVALAVMPSAWLPSLSAPTPAQLLYGSGSNAQILAYEEKAFGPADRAFALFRLNKPSPQDIKTLGKAIDGAAAALGQNPAFPAATCRRSAFAADKDELLSDIWQSHGLLLLPDDQLELALAKLTPAEIRKSVKRTARKLANIILSKRAERTAAFDAIGVGDILRAHKPAGFAEDAEQEETAPYLADKDANLLLLEVQPKEAAGALAYSRQVAQAVRAACAKALDNLPPAMRKNVSVEYGGEYEAAINFLEGGVKAFSFTSLAMLAGALIIFGLYLKQTNLLKLALCQLSCAILPIYLLSLLAYNCLDLTSCAALTLAAGLGLHWALQLHKAFGDSQEKLKVVAFDILFHQALFAIFAVALAGAFCIKLFILAATSIFIALVMAFLLAPAIAFSINNRSNAKDAASDLAYKEWQRRLQSLSACAKPGLIACGLIAVICMAIMAQKGGIAIDSSMAGALPPTSAADAKIALALPEKAQNSLRLISIIPTSGDVLEEAARQKEICAKLTAEKQCAGYKSLTSILPGTKAQEISLSKLKQIDFAAASKALNAALDEQGLAGELFAPAVELLKRHEKLAHEGRVIKPESFRGTRLEPLFSDFLAQAANNSHSAVRTQLLLNPDSQDASKLADLAAKLQALLRNSNPDNALETNKDSASLTAFGYLIEKQMLAKKWDFALGCMLIGAIAIFLIAGKARWRCSTAKIAGVAALAPCLALLFIILAASKAISFASILALLLVFCFRMAGGHKPDEGELANQALASLVCLCGMAALAYAGIPGISDLAFPAIAAILISFAGGRIYATLLK